ncbi:MAG: hypothetical protein HY314_12260 [Acidobacteria bacterium]|nr:hypothetical protein [Acidobacteriota bacterium]
MSTIGALLFPALILTLPMAAQDQRLVQAEQLYSRRPDLSPVRQAIALLTQLAQTDPNNYEAQWHLAKYYYFLGKHVQL